jgi:hypothetical protein
MARYGCGSQVLSVVLPCYALADVQMAPSLPAYPVYFLYAANFPCRNPCNLCGVYVVL